MTEKPQEPFGIQAQGVSDAPSKHRMAASKTHEQLLSYFWLAFKAILMTGMLAAFTADMVRFVMHSIDRIGK